MAKMKYMIVSKKMLAVTLATALLVISAVIVALTCHTAAPASSSARRIPIYAVESDKKTAALTFDAAWGNEDTETLINILKKYNVRATFFVVGEWAEKYPESVKALSDAGMEVMNHSSSHPYMTKLSRDEMMSEINECNDKIAAITGIKPMLFRAPYGDYNNAVIEVAEAQGMYSIQWNVDSLDWMGKSADEIVTRVTEKINPGSICLFHNDAEHTPEALPTLIERLQADGYTLLPVSELIYKENYTINVEGRQMKAAAKTGEG